MAKEDGVVISLEFRQVEQLIRYSLEFLGPGFGGRAKEGTEEGQSWYSGVVQRHFVDFSLCSSFVGWFLQRKRKVEIEEEMDRGVVF